MITIEMSIREEKSVNVWKMEDGRWKIEDVQWLLEGYKFIHSVVLVRAG